MDRNILYTVNITGDEWEITPISARESIEARKEGKMLEKALNAESSGELLYRACALSKSVLFGGEQVFSTGEQVLDALTQQEIFDLSEDITVRTEVVSEARAETKTEGKVQTIAAESAGETVKTQMQLYGAKYSVLTGTADSYGIPDSGYAWQPDSIQSNDSQGFRDRVITLSRYLERDSRRYDG